jgi:hypothetical protein
MKRKAVVGHRRSLTPTRAEEEQLARIRKRRLCVWILLLCLPLLWLVPSEWGAHVMALPWLVALSVATSLVSFSRCPQCQKFYHRPHGGGGAPVMWTQHCLSCGLPLRTWPRRVESS